MLTQTQEMSAKAIVNVFETGSVRGRYGAVSVIAGDTGGLSYGRSQATRGSGTLHDLVQQYCLAPGPRFGDRIEPFLQRMRERDAALDQDLQLKNWLRAAADDPVMRDTQDKFFHQRYWRPAMRAAEGLGVTSALGLAVIYDSHIHGSWRTLRDATHARFAGQVAPDQFSWITAYVDTRLDWLSHHRREDLRRTTYRMHAFQSLMRNADWHLGLPLFVRGQEISELSLQAPAPGIYSGPAPGTRVLALQTPVLRGLDVRLLQLALSLEGEQIDADGVYGRVSANAVARQQAQRGNPSNGTAEPGLILKLLMPHDLV